jgi:hypothetical protein
VNVVRIEMIVGKGPNRSCRMCGEINDSGASCNRSRALYHGPLSFFIFHAGRRRSLPFNVGDIRLYIRSWCGDVTAAGTQDFNLGHSGRALARTVARVQPSSFDLS